MDEAYEDAILRHIAHRGNAGGVSQTSILDYMEGVAPEGEILNWLLEAEHQHLIESMQALAGERRWRITNVGRRGLTA